MEELPQLTVDLVKELDKIFKEENSSNLLNMVRDGTVEFHLGQRNVVEYLKEKLKQEEEGEF